MIDEESENDHKVSLDDTQPHKLSLEDTQPHTHNHVVKKPSRWKRIRKKIWTAIERLALKLISKLLNISPPPSPTSESRHVNN